MYLILCQIKIKNKPCCLNLFLKLLKVKRVNITPQKVKSYKSKNQDKNLQSNEMYSVKNSKLYFYHSKNKNVCERFRRYCQKAGAYCPSGSRPTKLHILGVLPGLGSAATGGAFSSC